MISTKPLKINWLIYICCIGTLTFTILYITKEKLLLLQKHTKNLSERYQKINSEVFAEAANRDYTETISDETGIHMNKVPDYIRNGENIKRNTANGEMINKSSKIITSIPLSKGNNSTKLNSFEVVQPKGSMIFAGEQNKIDETHNFFVITAIFNPILYKSRYNLYHKFAQHMNDTGAQLITIECIFPSLNQHEFQVTEKKNPWHIQLKSESIYWMKENLINIAVSRLPPHAKWVSWLDADIEFEQKNWVELTINKLKKYTVVQMFEKANFLGPLPNKKLLHVYYSFGYSVIHNKSLDKEQWVHWYPHPGYGWAMSVSDFKKMNGLHAENIVGSSDRFFSFSLLNRISDGYLTNELKLSTHVKQVISEKGNQTFKTLQQISKSNFKDMVGYVPATINHHWHGSTKNRQYMELWKIFNDNDFDFKTDVIANEDGLLQITQNKPKLQADLLTFFYMRQEDKSDQCFHEDSKRCKAPLNFYEKR